MAAATIDQLVAFHMAVAAVCPIVGASIGDTSDNTTWTVVFDPSATPTQKAASASFISTYTLATPALYLPFETFITRCTIAEWLSIRVAEQSSAGLAVWLDLFRVRGRADLNSAATAAVKAGLVSSTVLTSNRANVIFGSP